MSLKGKKCLIVGGTKGIGLVTSLLLAKEGAEVIIIGRNHDQYSKQDHKINFIKCDITDNQQVELAFKEIIKKYKIIDCAFNNAGITSEHKTIADSDPETWHNVMRTNVDGIYNCLRQELKLMSNRPGGSIVNMSSCVALQPVGFQSAYIASKYAINGLTKVAAIEYAEHNIRVNAVAPGPTLGGMNSEEKLKANPEKTKRKIEVTAMKRFATPEEVAKTVIWLLSDESSYITGSVIPVDGGYDAGKF